MNKTVIITSWSTWTVTKLAIQHFIVVLIPKVQTHITTLAYLPLSEMFAMFVLYSQHVSFHNITEMLKYDFIATNTTTIKTPYI